MKLFHIALVAMAFTAAACDNGSPDKATDTDTDTVEDTDDGAGDTDETDA